MTNKLDELMDRLPNHWQESEIIKFTTKKVLAALLELLLHSDAKDSGVIFTNNKRLRQIAGVGSKQLMEGIRELMDYGVITRKKGAGIGTASEYHIDFGVLKQPIKKKDFEELFRRFMGAETPNSITTTTTITTTNSTTNPTKKIIKESIININKKYNNNNNFNDEIDEESNDFFKNYFNKKYSIININKGTRGENCTSEDLYDRWLPSDTYDAETDKFMAQITYEEELRRTPKVGVLPPPTLEEEEEWDGLPF